MNIAELLDGQARRFGARAAIVERRGRRITFAELNRASAAAAGSLSNAGLSAGMRAVVFSPMSIDLYVTVIALFRLGVVAVFLDPGAGSANLASCIARIRPDGFMAVPRAHLLRLISGAVRAIPIKIAIGGDAQGARSLSLVASSSDPPIHPCGGSTPAIITFTSGTTGEPKAVVRTHGCLRAQHRAIVEGLDATAGEIDLTTLPIFLLANLASGITSIIPDADLRTPGSIDPAPVLDQIRSERPTRMVASPALLRQLASAATQSGQSLHTLQKVFTGGAPVFPRTLDALAAVAPNASIVAVYGSSEAEPIASVNRRHIGSDDRVAMQQGAGLLAGKPAASIRVRVLPDRWGSPVPPLEDSEFERQTLGAGRPGEIVVTGDHVVRGYLDNEHDVDSKIVVGDEVWHRTGDAGYFDDRGRLWLLGRCSDRVMDDRGVLYPLAVEAAASEIAAIPRSAFLRHRRRRVLVMESEASTDCVRYTLLRRLAWAHLADVITVPRIPVDRRHNAKIDLPALREML